ncbi:MAG: hypothetical protein KDE59_28120 [Anaerolineales bacterium]|nr:hypothetical protein [Anaerolineales bacterium]
MYLKQFRHFLEVPATDPDVQRKAKTLNILLFGLTAVLLLVVIINNIGLAYGVYDPEEGQLTNVVSASLLLSAILIYLLNRYWSTTSAAVVFLLVMAIGLFFGDQPFESIWGRNTISLAIPIFATGLIYRSEASFAMAGFISLLSLATAQVLDIQPNIIGAIIYFGLALLAWLSSRSLEQAIVELRRTNQALDQRVADRTSALDSSILELQQQIIERQAAEKALRLAHDELEARVAARTQELRQANEQLQLEIEERRRTEINLEQHVQALAHSNAELEQFAYVASHDLREPLRKVRSFTELLQERYSGQLDEKADRYIEFIVSGASRMQALIADLLAYSRVGRRALELSDIDLNHLVNQVLSDLSLLIRESGAAIVVEPLPQLQADRNTLTQLLQNLLTNSIKFQHPDLAPEIHISATESAAEHTIAIADNGIGISPEFADRVFLIFQRLHTQDKYEGTGIGLAICKKIVQDHGGQIWFESGQGEGTTFYFTIPKRIEKRQLAQENAAI